MSLQHYRLIVGHFVLQGYSPDGDSARFYTDDPSVYRDLYRGYKVKPSPKDGTVQLRFEAADAPELHYGGAEQPLGLSARDAMLRHLGFSEVNYDSSKKVASCKPERVDGAILTSSADPYGRPISYILNDIPTGARSGQDMELSQTQLTNTVNGWLLSEGWAYDLFYTSTPQDHRHCFRSIAEKAKLAKKNIWRIDGSHSFALNGPQDIGPKGELIFPKLFRRATDYLKDRASGAFTGDLAEWLVWVDANTKKHENDDVLMPGSVEVHLNELIQQQNGHVSFTPDLLDIVFVEK